MSDNLELSTLQTPPTILIVDDNTNNLQLAANFLQPEGYNIAIATSGFEALEVVQELVPDLILLDVMMPDMDGYETCRRLKELNKLSPTPVIFLTAKTEVDDVVKGFQAGGVDYLTKPVRKEELIVRIKNHLDLKFARDKILLQNNKLTSLLEEIQNLVAITVHDLKTPINAIYGFIDMLTEYAEHLTAEEETNFKLMIKSATKNMIDIIDDLLTIYQEEKNTAKPKLIPTSTNEIAMSVYYTHNGPAQLKSIELKVLNTAPDDIVNIDIQKFMRALGNFISNAIKFSNPDTTVTLNISKSDTGKIIFEVRDQGPGISPTDMKKLFIKFAKLENKPTGGESSTGLGLAIVKMFVENMGGTVWAESEQGVGSSFFIEMPACNPDE